MTVGSATHAAPQPAPQAHLNHTPPAQTPTGNTQGPAQLGAPPSTDTGPAQRPTLETSRNALARFTADSGASLKAHQLQHQVDQTGGAAKPTDAPTPTREQVNAAVAEANKTGDMTHLNSIDRFRQGLSAEDQAKYDASLQGLRNDVRGNGNANGRIEFVYEDGAVKDPAAEDLALRGIATASFGREDLMNQAIDRGTQGDRGTFDIMISGKDDLDPKTPGREIGFAYGDNDMTLSKSGLFESLTTGTFSQHHTPTAGGNSSAHEFSHSMQAGGKPASNFGDFGILPNGATQEQVDEFKSLYFGAYGKTPTSDQDSVHYWTTVQEDFRYNPVALQQRSPELYNWMVNFMGHDPVASRTPKN